MDLIQMGEFTFEIMQLADGRYKWVLHHGDDTTDWGTAINLHDARRLLCDRMLWVMGQA